MGETVTDQRRCFWYVHVIVGLNNAFHDSKTMVSVRTAHVQLSCVLTVYHPMALVMWPGDQVGPIVAHHSQTTPQSEGSDPNPNQWVTSERRAVCEKTPYLLCQCACSICRHFSHGKQLQGMGIFVERKRGLSLPKSFSVFR
jgi:hypothetical protein